MAHRNGTAAKFGEETVEEVTTTTHFSLDKSAVRRIDADEVDINKSFVGYAKFDHGTLRQGSAGIIAGRSVAVDEVRTGILISPVVRGDVHTWLDMRSAVAIGFGMVMGKALLAGVRALARRATG
ncbi:MAG: hypothetical protein ABI577_02295 [bacterium]